MPHKNAQTARHEVKIVDDFVQVHLHHDEASLMEADLRREVLDVDKNGLPFAHTVVRRGHAEGPVLYTTNHTQTAPCWEK